MALLAGCSESQAVGRSGADRECITGDGIRCKRAANNRSGIETYSSDNGECLCQIGFCDLPEKTMFRCPGKRLCKIRLRDLSEGACLDPSERLREIGLCDLTQRLGLA